MGPRSGLFPLEGPVKILYVFLLNLIEMAHDSG